MARFRPTQHQISSAIVLVVLASAVMVVRGQRNQAPPSIPPAAIAPAKPLKVARLPENLELGPSNQTMVLAALRQNDQQWLPRLERMPNGKARYTYKRRSGEPAKTLDQLKAMANNPPSYIQEQRAIEQLLYELNRSGATVVIAQPKKEGAAGEWNPRRGEMRITQNVVGKGTVEFAKVLNHEAIHTAQSCAGGSIRSQPKPLGISREISRQAMKQLNKSVYAEIRTQQRILEEEAYANQDTLDIGRELLLEHCR
jgi:hypothetical protein